MTDRDYRLLEQRVYELERACSLLRKQVRALHSAMPYHTRWAGHNRAGYLRLQRGTEGVTGLTYAPSVAQEPGWLP